MVRSDAVSVRYGTEYRSLGRVVSVNAASCSCVRRRDARRALNA